MPVHTSLMGNDVRQSRRMIYEMEFRDPPPHRSHTTTVWVPCEYCGELFHCPEDTDIPLCDRCNSMWGRYC